MKKILLLDTPNLCHRAFHTFPKLKTRSGFPTGMVFGVLQNIFVLANCFKAVNFVWAFDSTSSNRKALYKGYKRNRKRDPEIYKQILHFRKIVLPKLGFKNTIIRNGYEADDIIAAYSKQKEKYIIVSNDADLYQCLNKNVQICNSRSRNLISFSTFRKKYGILPEQWKFAKAIGGCNSDAIPGIPGVGEKTALAFLVGELDRGSKKYNTIISNQKLIDDFLKIVCLPFDDNIKISRIKKDKLTESKFVRVFKKYELNLFLKDSKLWKRLVR